MKGLLFGQLVFDTWERHSTLSASQLQPSVAVNHDPIPRDYERLSKSVVALLSESRQLGSRNRELMPNIAGMRPEFVHAAGNEVATNVIHSSPRFTALASFFH